MMNYFFAVSHQFPSRSIGAQCVSKHDLNLSALFHKSCIMYNACIAQDKTLFPGPHIPLTPDIGKLRSMVHVNVPKLQTLFSIRFFFLFFFFAYTCICIKCCFLHSSFLKYMYLVKMANNVNPDQTAPSGTV